MKKYFIFIFIAASFAACGQAVKQKPNTVPASVITDDTTYWNITTVSTVGYVNTNSGPYYNNYKSGGGMIVKFKFKPGNRYEFMLYVQANTYGIENETWTQVEGDVEFTKDAKGQNIFITKAKKGTYRIIKNGVTTTRAISEDELKGQHSSSYLWERFDFPDDPDNTYLLLVDLKKNPKADVNVAGSIDPSSISKFHIPVKK